MLKVFTTHRGQHSRGSSSTKFGGPDTKILVVVADEDFDEDKPIHPNNSKIKQIVKAGEYYSQHTTQRSKRYTHAMARAYEIFLSMEAETAIKNATQGSKP